MTVPELPEHVLQGGTTHPVVRVGDTVRRCVGPWSPSVHALLRHLEAVEFDGAPRLLGIDDEGREMLTFIDGEVTALGAVDGMHTTGALGSAARRLREYHDAVQSFVPPPGARWRVQAGAPTDGDIVCHNDLGPHNTIYVDGRPHAFIDWDFAAPAPVLWDVVYAAWLFVPLFPPVQRRAMGWPEIDCTRRLVDFANAYGLRDRSAFVDTLLARQQVTHDLFVEWGAAGVPGFPQLLKSGRAEGVLRDIDFARQHAEEWQRALLLG